MNNLLQYYTYVYFDRKTNNIMVRGLDQDMNRHTLAIDNFTPMVWVPLSFNYNRWSRDIINHEGKVWKSLIDNSPLTALTFKDIESCKSFVHQNTKTYKNHEGQTVRNTVVHTTPNNCFVSQYIAENFQGERHVGSENLKIYSYDIETEIGHRNVPADTPVKCRHIAQSSQYVDPQKAAKTMTIEQFEGIGDIHSWELYDKSTDSWVTYNRHPYRYIGGFPDPLKAEERITLITVKDVNSRHITTWGCEDFDNQRSDVEYRQFSSEEDLLKDFVLFLEQDYPDIMTGWNCLNKNSTVWKENEIVTLSNVNKNDLLVDSTVLRKSDITHKEEYVIDNCFNQHISCSKDHIFPCLVVDKNKHINFNTDCTNAIDLSVSDIIHTRNSGNEVFQLIPEHNNINKDLTYKDLILSDVEYYFNRYQFINNNGDIINNIDQLRDYMNTHSHIKCQFNVDNIITLNVDDCITNDICHVLGLVYNNGAYNKACNSYTVYNSDINIIKNLDRVFCELNTDNLTKASNEKVYDLRGGVYSANLTSNNKFELLHHMIYGVDGIKKLNLNLLSKMSYQQFNGFVSGLIDGDGTITNCHDQACSYSTSVSYCSHNNDVATLQELLLWNNYVSFNEQSTVIKFAAFQNDVLKTNLTLWRTIHNQPLSVATVPMVDNSKTLAKDVNYTVVNIDGQNYYVVKISSVQKTNNIVEMLDIETSSHYFYTQGVKTHNCSVFDNTYVANRIKKVLGTDWMNRLSPFHDIHFKSVKMNEFGKTITETTWEGIANLDYIKLYKKFTYGNRESYKLDDVASDEIGSKKIPNPTGGSFKDFYSGEFDVRTKPENDDHNIKKLGYIRTQLKDSLKDHPENIEKYNQVNTKLIQMCKQLFIEYNIRDVELVDQIDAKLHFIDLIMVLAYAAHCNYADVFGPVKTWDYLIYNYCNDDHKVIPIQKSGVKSEKYPGAFVKDPLKGKHEYCESFDLDSLYPHLIMQYNISPETLLRNKDGGHVTIPVNLDALVHKKQDTSEAHKLNYSMASSGVCFSKDRQGIMPFLMEKFYSARKLDKKQMLKTKSEHEKIMLELHKRGVEV